MTTVWQGSALALIFSAVSSLCQAQGAIAGAQAGSAVAQACQACHGPAGEGMAQMGSPRLAGLGSSYLRRQLDAFADGTRANPLMGPIAKALSPADRVAVADYFAAARLPSVGAASAAAALPTAVASLPASAAASAGLPTQPSAGALLATRGRWSEQLPACEQCHGPDGRGAGPDFPALTGQSAAYLASQLSAWKAGIRPPGPLNLMAVVAKKLTAADIRSVSEHFAALPVSARPAPAKEVK